MQFKQPVLLADIIKCCQPVTVQVPVGAVLSQQVHHLDSPEFSQEGSVTFLPQKPPHSTLEGLNSAFIITEGTLSEAGVPYMQVSCIHEAIKLLLVKYKNSFIYPETGPVKGTSHPSAVVCGQVCSGAVVGAGCFVGEHSVIGEGAVLEPNCVIMENTVIGRGSHIQPGAVIGSAGFGFYNFQGHTHHLPHLAGVRIGESVWVGANTVIASGVLNPTIIGDECRLDSHVQIAHNVILGPGAYMASQSGIAGSTRIGSGFRAGGASSVDGHLRLGDNVSVAACSGVTKNIPDNSTVAGFPAQPLNAWRRQHIYLRQSALKSHSNPPEKG